MNAFLEIRGLGFAWPGQAPLFTHLNASLTPGLALLSGDEQRGKTTLLRLLAAEIRPQAGAMQLAGQDIGGALAGLRPDMTRPDLDTVVVADWLRTQVPEGPARDRLDEHIDGLSLGEHLHKGFYMLSAGGRRKVGLAAAMALQPPLTLLDQPFAALDLASIRYLSDWLREQSQATDRLVLLADYEAPADLAIAQRIDLG
ncbi:ATP-binding cassette domain-containing protein [Hydrogenophaga sp. NH-16]|uniref:ABC transporter ATP-binding protein n=1 Tax=Hydrogenophaga sp. NH-16 TaxID=2184519 RepID=UPI0013E3EF09|nr:ATP-binding cassette domain-containing protein [Hydrogenophaga sp. NH-16]